MTEYIHDEWCDTRLTVPSECNCYVAVIRRLEARIEALEKERDDAVALIRAAGGTWHGHADRAKEETIYATTVSDEDGHSLGDDAALAAEEKPNA